MLSQNAQVAGLAARLPTEAEWERACRAGTTGATWVGEFSGNTKAPKLEAIAWYDRNNDNITRSVGLKAPNPYGLYDMLGNVREWCADGKRAYSAEPVTDPVGDGRGSERVSRGGWGYGSRGRGGTEFVRAAYRWQGDRRGRSEWEGFRLAADQQSASSRPAGEPRSGYHGRPPSS